jgi:cellulose biosynthesis protein BcsQ
MKVGAPTVLGSSLVVAANKGGTLKTTSSTELSAGAAAAGYRVLLISLDPQGDVGYGLNVMERSDGGANLDAAIRGEQMLDPIRDVRERLDVCPGGPALADTRNWIVQQALSGGFYQGCLDAAVGPIAGNYDLIVIDTPPAVDLMIAAAFHTAHYVLIPTRIDAASLSGLGGVFTSFTNARNTTNPDIEILGVVLTAVPKSATRELSEVRAYLDDLLGPSVPIIEPPIREATIAAKHHRDRGLVSFEYEAEANRAEPWYQRLRDGADTKKEAKRYSKAAQGLAEEYQQLTQNVLTRFVERQHAYIARISQETS